MKKRLISIILVFLVITSQASAAILGSSLVSNSSLYMGNGTTLYKNTFLSDQSGVGLQSEYYAEYTPNRQALPVVVTGESIWGKRTISEAINYMESNNMCPMIGINASFFSFQTGVPMGHVITNGEITSKDNTELDAVGFYSDGSAFISRLGIKTTASFGVYEFDVAHINKYCQASTEVLTLFTDKFGKTTNAVSETINVILGEIEGDLAIGKSVSGTVENIRTVSGAVDIPEGKIVLTINTTGNQWIVSVLRDLEIGERVTITSEAMQDKEHWNNAFNGLASEGKRLLTNGVVASGLEAGAAPRTAVGITAEGNVIFYVLDGRQNGYSYGAKQQTIAERLNELGCVDALNLDGGGSTSIAGVYPGQNASSVINSPSEGALRKVTNFIFIQNMLQPTHTLGGLYLYPYGEHCLSDSTLQLCPAAVDSAYRYMDVGNVEYSMENNLGEVTQDGMLTLHGSGEAVVNITSGNISGSASYFTYENPTSISVYNTDNGENISYINAPAGAVLKLGGHAYYGKKYLYSTPNAYDWQLDAELGNVENGVLKLSKNIGASGNLNVRAGDAIISIPVEINSSYESDAAELYPYSETLVYSDKITVDMYSYNEHIDVGESYVKIDGKLAENIQMHEVDARHTVFVIPVDESFEKGYHKILVKTQTTDGYASIQPDYVKSLKVPDNFDDTEGHWAQEIISYMNNQAIVNGDKNMFYPDNYMTRAEFAVMMCNFLNYNPQDYEYESTVFTDMNIIPEWAQNYVKAMSATGIIRGKRDGDRMIFAANDKITRAEAAAIIERTLPDNLRKGEMRFSDLNDIPNWAISSMAIMSGAGFIRGYPDNTIRPNAGVTRAEAVSMLYNVF